MSSSLEGGRQGQGYAKKRELLSQKACALLSALLTVVLPVLLVIGVGALAGKRLFIDIGSISRLSLYVLTPALALHSLLHTSVKASDVGLLVAAYYVLALCGVAVAWLLTGTYAAPTRRAVMASVAIGNNGNYGLPVALFALGKLGFEQAVVIFLCSVVLTYTLGPVIYGGGSVGATFKGMLRLPVVWCLALAAVLRAAHLSLPLGLDRSLDLLSGATLPVVLLSLGIQLGTGGRPKLSAPVVLASSLRVVLMPALGLGLGLALGLRGLNLQGLVLASAMPTAVNAFILAREYAADSETVASTVLITTLLSVPALTVLVPLLPRLPAP